MLLDRTRYRRYDPTTGKVYHIPDDAAEAMSPPIQPERADGTLDTEVLARWVGVASEGVRRHGERDRKVLASGGLG